ncbi:MULTISPECIES: transcriptional regulator [Streptomyces violaceusniger group]|uniref:transcriptional regulator n=1 Tax=Streptomyces javensis TaxID=114698 RepID=UPI003CD05DFE
MEWAEFGWVRESAGLSPSALSKQVSTLETRGYVEVKKGYVGKRPEHGSRSPRPDGTPSKDTWRRCAASSRSPSGPRSDRTNDAVRLGHRGADMRFHAVLVSTR